MNGRISVTGHLYEDPLGPAGGCGTDRRWDSPASEVLRPLPWPGFLDLSGAFSLHSRPCLEMWLKSASLLFQSVLLVILVLLFCRTAAGECQQSGVHSFLRRKLRAISRFKILYFSTC